MRMARWYSRFDQAIVSLLEHLEAPDSMGASFVHLLVFDKYIKLGKTMVCRASIARRPQAVGRLRCYVQKAQEDGASLEYAPVVFVSCSPEKDALLETFAHSHMTRWYPEMKLNMASDPGWLAG